MSPIFRCTRALVALSLLPACDARTQALVDDIWMHHGDDPSEPQPADAGVAYADASPAPVDQPLASLGEQLFHDQSLSLSGTESCASCHQPARAFTGNNHRPEGFPVSEGAFPELLGTRNSPSAMYTSFIPPFAFVADPEDPTELGPVGGLFWDGRAADLEEQARGPFLNPRELALPDAAAVVDKVRVAPYRAQFLQVFGANALDDDAQAYLYVSQAIAAFERSAAFAPFSSRFDEYLRGTGELSELEARGFELFKDPEKGNCIACHVGDPASSEPSDWLFTDFTFDNLGVPRNQVIPDNANAETFDLGLCAQPGVSARVPEQVPDKEAFLDSLCGAFKVPSLRNVALTAPYMHNGYFSDLRQVVEFYVTRSTNPERWYPRDADGSLRLYDDLPARYHENVNTEEVPYDRALGEAPRLDDAEIDAVVAFLNTLTDALPGAGAGPSAR
jgi:cytochrome c peroxidase